MRLTLLAATLIGALACASHGPSQSPSPSTNGTEWTAYGRDVLGGRYSALTQIDTSNVARLAVAWTYHTGEMPPSVQTRNRRSLEATPIVVDGLMYLITPMGRIIALDPETGTERWSYDAKLDRSIGFGDHTSRGVSTWLDPTRAAGQPCRRSLDAANGKPCEDFGDHGVVDLRVGLRNPPFEKGEYEETSAPLVVHDLVVV